MAAAPHPFRIANFRYYWTARLTATLAQTAMMLIIGWQVYNIARDDGLGVAAASARLGLIGLVQFLPLFALTPVTGWVADRVDRRQIARATMALQILCAAVLAYATWAGTIDLFILYSVAFLLGIARAFSGPALGALAPNLVPRESLPNAIALSSISWQAGMVAGPGLGGYLYAWVPEASYIGAVLLFAVSLACLSTEAAIRSARWSTASPMSVPTGWCSPRSPSISSPSSSPERPRSFPSTPATSSRWVRRGSPSSAPRPRSERPSPPSSSPSGPSRPMSAPRCSAR
jgi:MFS family permease